jgi:hypothetical protein
LQLRCSKNAQSSSKAAARSDRGCRLPIHPSTTNTHPRERRATPRIVDDLGDDALDVGVALGRVIDAVLGRALAVGVVRLEHRPATLTLATDNAPHLLEGLQGKV